MQPAITLLDPKMADGGEQVSRALAIMDQFYVAMTESGVLKILSFQYECFPEISESTYLKFLANFNLLASSVKSLHEDIFTTEHTEVACQTDNQELDDQSNIKNIFSRKERLQVSKVQLASEITVEGVLKTKTRGNASIKRDPMLCDYCEQRFTTLESFEHHIREVHGEKFSRALFTCQICNQHFLSLDNLYEHVSCAHSNIENDDENERSDELCPYCAEIKLSWKDLSDHLINEHNIYMCKTCNLTCETEKKLQEHISVAHLTGIRAELLIEAPVPAATARPVGRPPKNKQDVLDLNASSTPKKRGRPRKIVTEETECSFSCNLCELIFPTKDNLKRHVQFSHYSVTKEIVCKKCNLKFRRTTALDNHMRIVHNKYDYSSDSDSEKKNVAVKAPPVHKEDRISTTVANVKEQAVTKPSSTTNSKSSTKLHCEVCGELCLKVEDQEIHKDHHATIKRDYFLCLYCKAPAMKQHELRTHIVSEHRYRCPFCSLTFWWKANLENHLLQLHNSKEECPICTMKDQGESLRQHVLMHHTPRKLYLCKICNAEYLTVREMHEHEMYHAKSKDNPYNCEFCQRIFWTKRYLKSHLLRHLHGSFCCYLCGQQCQTQEELQEHLSRHRKSQFACFCGQRFAKKTDLQAHQKSRVCKQGAVINEAPRPDILVEVCVPIDDDEDILDGETLLGSTAKLRLSEDEPHSNVWQINIIDTPAQLSRDFLSALAHSVVGNQEQDNELLSSENQPVLILDTGGNESTESSEQQPAEIVQWIQDIDSEDKETP